MSTKRIKRCFVASCYAIKNEISYFYNTKLQNWFSIFCETNVLLPYKNWWRTDGDCIYIKIYSHCEIKVKYKCSKLFRVQWAVVWSSTCFVCINEKGKKHEFSFSTWIPDDEKGLQQMWRSNDQSPFDRCYYVCSQHQHWFQQPPWKEVDL